jgi:glycosyltransferase involved in cell wall biosynthesis
MKLVLVIPAITAGGAERVMSILANHWAARDRDIALLTFDDGAEPPFFALDPRIRHRTLSLLGDSANPVMGLLNNLRRLRVLRRAIRRERPDAVVSFLDTTNVLTLLASLGLSVPVIVAEHIEPSQYRVKLAWAMLRRWLYPVAGRVVLLTERAREFFPASLGPKIVVIPNPVVPVAAPGGAGIPLPEGHKAVAMGRLVEQKGFDYLLEAFARLADRHPQWSLLILGEGPLRGELESLRDRLGLAGRALLPGRVECPEAVLAESDLFVLSSRFEGFPMALCEAMACGLPVVAFDCPTGPREIIREGYDGVLVPPADPERLAEAMDRLMADPDERRRLAEKAPQVIDRFGLERVMGLWEEALLAAIAKRQSPARPA